MSAPRDESKSYQIDVTADNRVIVKWSEKPRTEEVFKQFLNDLGVALYSRKQPMTMYVSTEKVSSVPMTWVSNISKWMQANQDKARAYLKKTAIVTDGPFVNLFLRAAFKLKPPVTQVKVFDKRKAALLFLEWSR